MVLLVRYCRSLVSKRFFEKLTRTFSSTDSDPALFEIRIWFATLLLTDAVRDITGRGGNLAHLLLEHSSHGLRCLQLQRNKLLGHRKFNS